MSEVKQVKVDNWGIYFLQRLKHFFNRTDYCDLTLQFQDNAQLKVHRLVLSACTEYFELLERTCEMYEDCLVMPDDLQADVVVPIINFMYTGQLEFKVDLLEKLYQTSLIMNMPVLTKLLASHRSLVQQQPRTAANNYYGKRYVKQSKSTPPSSSNASNKRTFSSAFSNAETPKSKKPSTMNKIDTSSNSKNSSQDLGESQVQFPVFYDKNNQLTKGARPTRYELPEELEEDNIFDNSFTSISYTSKPLMVHPDTTKQYRSKRINLFEEGSSTSRFMHNNDIVECKKITVNSNIFLDESSDMLADENDLFQQSPSNKEEIKDSNQLFDQIIENDVSNITIETKNKQSGNLDHAKIISEVLKKYPHLVKSNKQIKLKILNTAANKTKKPRANTSNIEEKEKIKTETRDFTYETDVIDSKEAARLIALGAENVKGPWICLICGTPGKALHFTKYYNFRKHLVEVHNEKPVPNICEYCGLKSQKRNYLVHHQLTKHGVEPPSHYNFPKCNYCDYIALNEALLVKHKITHTDISNYKRNICNAAFAASLMDTMQKSNNKHASYEKKNNLVCMYCLRVFLRQNNLYAHLKTNHKEAAKNDGFIYDSEEENAEEEEKMSYKSKSNDITNFIKVEVPVSYEYEDVQYQLERRSDGNIHVVSKKPRVVMPVSKHKILNPGFITQQQTLPSLVKPQQKTKTLNTPTKGNEFIQEICLSPSNNVNQEEIVVIDNNEYIVRDYQLFPKTSSTENKEESLGTILPTTSMEFHNIHNQIPETKMFIKKSTNLNQPLQIVVSNEEEYKTLMNSNQSVIFDDTDSGKTLTVLAAADNSTMEAGTINLSNTQSNEMMIIPDDFSINVSEAVSGDNSNIVVVYSHPVEDPNKQYQLIATQEVGLEFVQSSDILTQSFETVTTCSTVATTQTTGESWPSNIQATISKLPITSTADLQTMTVGESVTVPCETVSSDLNEYPDVTLTSNEPVPMDTDVIESQEQNQSDEVKVITNIEQSIESSCESKADMTLDQQLIEDNSVHQQPISESDVQSSVDHVETTVITDLISTPAVEEQSSISHHSDLTMVSENPQEIINPEPVINVIVPELEIQHTAGMDNIESVIENVENANIDVDPSNSEISPQDTDTLLTSSDDHIVPQEIPIVADVVNEIQNLEDQTQEQTTEEMEVAETIENIARDIGVDPNSMNKEIQSDVPEILPDTETINSENIALKTVTNEQIQSLTSEWSEDESEIAESVPNGENVNSEHGNENIAEMSNGEHMNSDLGNKDKLIEVEESIENIQHEIQRHVSEEIIDNTANIHSVPDVNVTITAEEPDNKEPIVETPIISNPKISSLLHDWDDNDSQEEDSTVTENKIEETTPVIQNNDVETVKESEEKEDSSNNDKIKSLVSDWDEDDEENKD